MKRIFKSIFLLLLILLVAGSNNLANNEEDTVKGKEDTINEDKADNNNEQQINENNNKEDMIYQKIKTLTIDEKIGQMIISGFDGTNYSEEISNLINQNKVGGLILFGRNINSTEETAALIEEINNQNNSIPLFISIDEEGGSVTRLPGDGDIFPSAMSIGEQNDTQIAYDNGNRIGSKLKSIGINMNHAPVLDIFSNPNNTVIGDRSFGSNPEIVSSMGLSTMRGMEDAGVIPTVKHFPGHGDTEVDSHYGLPIVYKDYEELDSFEFIPFKEAIQNNCEVIMVSHIILNEIDDISPASLSKDVVTGILRGKMGYNQVIMTDDMAMGAITNYLSVEEASVKSIEAGCDIILLGNAEECVDKVIDDVKEKIINNEISEERINESVYRILKLKEKYGIWEMEDE